MQSKHRTRSTTRHSPRSMLLTARASVRRTSQSCQSLSVSSPCRYLSSSLQNLSSKTIIYVKWPFPENEHRTLQRGRIPLNVYENEYSSIIAYTLASSEYAGSSFQLVDFPLSISNRIRGPCTRKGVILARIHDACMLIKEVILAKVLIHFVSPSVYERDLKPLGLQKPRKQHRRCTLNISSMIKARPFTARF